MVTKSYYSPDIDVLENSGAVVTATNLAPLKRIAWAAVFAGVVLAIVIQLLLNMLGTGIGVSTIDPLAGETPAIETLALSAGIWWIASSFIALFIGGWVAGHLAGVPRNLDGMIHGLLTWSVATLFVVLLAGTAVGTLLGGVFNAIGGGIAAVAPHAARAASDVLAEKDINITWNKIVEEARQLMRDTGKPALQPEALNQQADQAARSAEQATAEAVQDPAMSDQKLTSLLDRLLRRGDAIVSEVDREAAINVLVARTDMSQAEAARTVDNWIGLYQRAAAQTKQEARKVADTTADAIARSMIWGFLAFLFGAAAAGCGGVIGAPRMPIFSEVASNMRSQRVVSQPAQSRSSETGGEAR